MLSGCRHRCGMGAPPLTPRRVRQDGGVGPKANRQAECRSLEFFTEPKAICHSRAETPGKTSRAPTLGVSTEKVKEVLRWS
jgi:hypothetical protein